MTIRLQADNDLDQRIVFATRRLEPAIDFQTAPEAGLHGLTDPAVLGLAAQQGRILDVHFVNLSPVFCLDKAGDRRHPQTRNMFVLPDFSQGSLSCQSRMLPQ
jgi:hypothetical protein